jgi:hypothetical protein
MDDTRARPDSVLPNTRALIPAPPAEPTAAKQRLFRAWQQRLRRARARLQREAKAVADQQRKLERDRRELDGETELSRRQLNAAWQRFRHEESAWQELQRRQAAALHGQRMLLAQRLSELERSEAVSYRLSDDLAHAQSIRERELQGLEHRVRSYRQVLIRLQEQTAGLERRAEDLAAARLPCPAAPVTVPTGANRPAQQALSLPLLSEIGNVVQDLLDQNRRLDEHQDQLVRLREAWQLEWERAIGGIAEREGEVQEQEQRLHNELQVQRRWSETLQHQADELAVRQRQYRAWEARLLKQQSNFRCEEARLQTRVRAKVAAAASRHRKASRLLAKVVLRHGQMLELYKHLVEKVQAERATVMDQKAAQDQRAAALDQRERDVAMRELVLFQAYDQLVSKDPRPVAAEFELQRRARLVKQLAERPLAGLQHREAELSAIHGELESFRNSLLADQARLLQEHHDLVRAQARLARDRMAFEVGREQADREIAALRSDRDRLQQHASELNEQLERLTLLLMEVTPPGPRVAMAA